MSIVISVIGAIFAIFSVVIIHEFGHFIVARLMGVRVLKFSIGFGKALWSRTSKTGTEFVIAILPLGGYVRMLGEGDDAPPQDMKRFAYNRKPILARMAIILAGPVMNFILAIFLFWIIFLSGIVHIKPMVGQVIPNSIAAQGGLRSGDVIEKIDGRRTRSWQQVVMRIVARMGDNDYMRVTVLSKDSPVSKKLAFSLKNWSIEKRKPDFFKSLGLVPYRPKYPTVIDKVLKNTPAAKAGLRAGDKIIAVNGVRKNDMLAVIKIIQANPGKALRLTILRNGRRRNLTIRAGVEKEKGKQVGFLGFMVKAPKWPANLMVRQDFSMWSAWVPAAEQAWMLTSFNAVVLAKMIIGKISLKSLGGPISIFHIAGKASQHNYRVYLGFIAFISVTLGFINLLPIPGLDGGHFLFQLIEVVFRRPVPERIQVICVKVGILLLIFLMLQATFNDITRLFV